MKKISVHIIVLILLCACNGEVTAQQFFLRLSASHVNNSNTPYTLTVLANKKIYISARSYMGSDTILTLKKNSATEYEVMLTHPGATYSPLLLNTDTISVNTTINFHFLPKVTTLGEVIVKNDKPYYKGDTLVIPVDSIKIRPHAAASALINKVPGMDVSNSGEVKVNGKRVEEITVNGQTLFGGNAKATLDAIKGDMVQQLEVVERENSSGQKIPSLNLRLKKGRSKGWYGDVGGNLGNADTRRGDFRLNYIKPGLYINSFINHNNINERALSEQSLFSFTNSFKRDIAAYSITEQQSQGGMMVKDGGNDSFFDTYFTQYGINQSTSLGVSASSTKNKTSMEGFALAERSNRTVAQDYLGIQYIAPLRQFDSSYSTELTARTTILANTGITHKSSERNTFKLAQTLRVMVDATANNKSSTNTIKTEAGNTVFNNLIQNFSDKGLTKFGSNTQAMWLHRYKKTAKIFSLYTQYDYEQQDNHHNYINNSSNAASRGNNQWIERQRNRYAADIQAVQSFPINRKILLEARFNNHYDRTTIYQDALDYDSSLKIYGNPLPMLQANPLRFDNLKSHAMLSLLHKKTLSSLVMGVGLYYWQSNRERNNELITRQSRALALPFVQYKTKLKSSKTLLFSYRPGWDIPAIDQLNPLADSAMLQQVRAGNPWLDGSFKHSASANISISKRSGNIVSAALQYVHINDPVSTTTDALSNGFVNNNFTQYGSGRQVNFSLFWLNFSGNKPLTGFASLLISNNRSYAINNKLPFLFNSTFGMLYFGGRWKINKQTEADLRWQATYNRFGSGTGSRGDFRHAATVKLENTWPKEFYTTIDANLQFNGANTPGPKLNPFIKVEMAKYFGKNNRCRLTAAIHNLFNTDNTSTFNQTTTQQSVNRFNALPRFVMAGFTFYFDRWTGKD